MEQGRSLPTVKGHFVNTVEEEFAFVLECSPVVSLNGAEYESQPLMGVDFKAGSGVAYTLINKSNDKIYYPEHPKRNDDMRKVNALREEKVSVN